MRKPLTASLAVVVALGVAFALTGGIVVARAAGHPEINDAYRRLMRAQYLVQHSCHQLGGHREAALKHVEAALNQLKLAAQTVHASLPAASGSGPITNISGSMHPRIQEAINQCREAKRHLASAAHDFGGHRTKAVQDIDGALAELRLAMSEPPCKKK
jgi:hypothetical protein